MITFSPSPARRHLAAPWVRIDTVAQIGANPSTTYVRPTSDSALASSGSGASAGGNRDGRSRATTDGAGRIASPNLHRRCRNLLYSVEI